MEKKQNRRAVASYDEQVGQSARSQLRRRFDLGGDSTATTQPNVIRSADFRAERKTARPDPRAFEPIEPADPYDGSDENTRPTIPTPRPRLALGCVPRRIVDDKEMMALPLDHRAAFLLMHIDGKTPLHTLIDVTGMHADEVVVLVERLVELHAVAVL
jgi:hypothetical protein